jgi:hypothetical protein
MVTLEKHFEEEWKRPELITAERREFHKFVDAIYPFWNDGMSEDVERSFFESHNRSVLEHAERDQGFNQRFLVWRPEQGWEPLCKALRLPVPNISFPHENKRTEFHGY